MPTYYWRVCYKIHAGLSSRKRSKDKDYSHKGRRLHPYWLIAVTRPGCYCNVTSGILRLSYILKLEWILLLFFTYVDMH